MTYKVDQRLCASRRQLTSMSDSNFVKIWKQSKRWASWRCFVRVDKNMYDVLSGLCKSQKSSQWVKQRITCELIFVGSLRVMRVSSLCLWPAPWFGPFVYVATSVCVPTKKIASFLSQPLFLQSLYCQCHEEGKEGQGHETQSEDNVGKPGRRLDQRPDVTWHPSDAEGLMHACVVCDVQIPWSAMCVVRLWSLNVMSVIAKLTRI